jgi:C1A family cysteine protease
VFKANLLVHEERNRKEKLRGGSARHGVTIFSDLTQQEFEQRYLMNPVLLNQTRPSVQTSQRASSLHDHRAMKNKFSQMSSTFIDWTGVLTTPVKDQGYCGSCWAFSAMEQIESDTIRLYGSTQHLSAEQLVDCANSWNGCSGSWTYMAYNSVMNKGGIEREVDYPYTAGATGTAGTCSYQKNLAVVTISSYTYLQTEADMVRCCMLPAFKRSHFFYYFPALFRYQISLLRMFNIFLLYISHVFFSLMS